MHRSVIHWQSKLATNKNDDEKMAGIKLKTSIKRHNIHNISPNIKLEINKTCLIGQ